MKNYKLKRVFAATLCCGLLITSITGCGVSTDSNDDAEEAEEETSTILML